MVTVATKKPSTAVISTASEEARATPGHDRMRATTTATTNPRERYVMGLLLFSLASAQRGGQRDQRSGWRNDNLFRNRSKRRARSAARAEARRRGERPRA